MCDPAGQKSNENPSADLFGVGGWAGRGAGPQQDQKVNNELESYSVGNGSSKRFPHQIRWLQHE